VTDVGTAGEPAEPAAERLAELRSSARGWHGIQLAVIGFVGLCGVLKGEGSGAPDWVEALAGYLALASLALACIATYQVGRAAWPFYDVRRAPPPAAEELLRTSRRITTGLALTFVAVALVALAGLSSWWPSGDEGGGGGGDVAVELEAGGTSVCGPLVQAQPGAVAVVASGRQVAVPIEQLTGLRPVDGC
jgi:hypothetical protein